jgi:hypothetical protein
MSLKLLWLTAAGALIVGGVPVRAHQAPEAEAQVRAEQEADRAVAEARAEVLAEAQAEAAADGEADAVRPVTISDVRAGSAVHDTQGGVVGTVESVDERGAVVSTGRARARLPFRSFGRNGRGLVIAMTRAQFEAEVAARTPS